MPPDRCTFCGRCSEVCRYGAIACVNKQVLIFAELCHSCGGCLLACPADAMREVPKPIGELRLGAAGSIVFREGRLNVGEAMSPPAIRAVNAHLGRRTILDVKWVLDPESGELLPDSGLSPAVMERANSPRNYGPLGSYNSRTRITGPHLDRRLDYAAA